MLHCFYLLYVTWWVISVNSSHWVGRKRSLNPALLLLFRMSVVKITVIVILVTATPLFSSAATTADQS